MNKSKVARFESFLSELQNSGANKEMVERIRIGFKIVTEAEIEPEVQPDVDSEPEVDVDVDVDTEIQPTSKFSDLKDLAINLLYDAQQFHIWHLNCGLIAEHMALQDVYEFLVDFSDDIAEAVIGIEDSIIESSTTSFAIERFAYDKQTAIGKLGSIKEMMQTSLNSMNEEDGIVNILADGIQNVDKFIYKLKRFE